MSEEHGILAHIHTPHHPGGVTTRFPAGETPTIGQGCLVAFDFGAVYGEVSALPAAPDPRRALHAFVRHAQKEDAAIDRENRRLAEEAVERLRVAVRKDGPPIKVISGVFSHARDRLIVFIGAPETVDIRRHTGPIQRAYNTRISIRLVGLREEAARIGTIGICGRPACCCSWMRGSFQPVNVRMARIQNVPATPQALNGVCTRLKCCMSHEYAFYRDAAPTLPAVGDRITAPDGSPAAVIARNLLTRTLTLRNADNRFFTVTHPDSSPHTERPAP